MAFGPGIIPWWLFGIPGVEGIGGSVASGLSGRDRRESYYLVFG